MKAKAEFFDRLADEWSAHGYKPGEVARIRTLMERAGVAPGMSVLEPGCGPGLATVMLAELVGAQGRVLALDLSEEMALKCRGRTAHLAQVEVAHGAVEELHPQSGEFDLAFCFNAFPHFCDRRQALTAIHAQLKPGGKLVIAHSISRARVNEIHRSAGGAVAADTLPPPEELSALLADCGFAVGVIDDGEDSFFAEGEKVASPPQAGK